MPKTFLARQVVHRLPHLFSQGSLVGQLFWQMDGGASSPPLVLCLQDVDLSVAAQLRALRDYAERNGYSITREYVDEAESGRIADRPQFRRMLDEAASGKSGDGSSSNPRNPAASPAKGPRCAESKTPRSESGVCPEPAVPLCPLPQAGGAASVPKLG